MDWNFTSNWPTSSFFRTFYTFATETLTKVRCRI